MNNNQKVKSIRAFIGAKDYKLVRFFYRDLGFEETIVSEKMSLFTTSGFSFYLQDYYVKDWIENIMMLLEVEDVDEYWRHLQQLELDKRYAGTRLIPAQQYDWGKECLLIDPSGVLWHFATFC